MPDELPGGVLYEDGQIHGGICIKIDDLIRRRNTLAISEWTALGVPMIGCLGWIGVCSARACISIATPVCRWSGMRSKDPGSPRMV